MMNNTEVRETTEEKLNDACCTFDDSLTKEYFEDFSDLLKGYLILFSA